jgi:indolepyruvate ferredoxin oxidoreductase
VQSNCVSIQPLETDFGRKRAVDQSNCNKDYSCVGGFCPAFVSVDGAVLRKPAPPALATDFAASLPPPPAPPLSPLTSVLVTGIGGTGVVTIGAVLGMAAHLEGKASSTFDMTGLAQKGGAVLSHIRIATRPELIASPRLGVGEADLVLGCDLVVAAANEALRTMDDARTRVVVNSHLVPTAAFVQRPDVDFHTPELLAAVDAAADEVARVDATGAALRLLGDTLAANMFIVGYALQQGWLPLGPASIERAIELNGAAVTFNLRALALGRLAAADPACFAAMLGPTESAPSDATFDSLVSSRVAFLTGYQNAAYAGRYAALVARVAEREAACVPGEQGLATAVARYYFKLLAYKDEYEVARLHAGTAFRAQLASTFSGPMRLRFHLAPPWLARGAKPEKREFGGWLMPLFGLLAAFRFLRGTALDPFGRAPERRRERALITEYEALVTELCAGLTPARHALAVELASVPEHIRGYGHVKARHLAVATARQAELLRRWRDATTGASGATALGRAA